MPETKNDPVNHPAHYTDGKIEVIDFIEDKQLGYHLGNAVKYISRAGKKDPSKTKEDLEKAGWYIERFMIKYPFHTPFGMVGEIEPPVYILDKNLGFELSSAIECIVHPTFENLKSATIHIKGYIDKIES